MITLKRNQSKKATVSLLILVQRTVKVHTRNNPSIYASSYDLIYFTGRYILAFKILAEFNNFFEIKDGNVYVLTNDFSHHKMPANVDSYL